MLWWCWWLVALALGATPEERYAEAVELLQTGQPDAAELLATEVADELAANAPESPLRVDMAAVRAAAAERSGELALAERRFIEAISLAQELWQAQPERIEDLEIQRAHVVFHDHRPEEALALYEALRDAKAARGDEAGRVKMELDVVQCLIVLGRIDEAARRGVVVVERARELLVDEPGELAGALLVLERLRARQGDIEGGLSAAREATELLRPLGPSFEEDLGIALCNLGQWLIAVGDYPAALRTVEEGYRLLVARVGPGGPDVAAAERLLATLYLRGEQLERAEQLATAVLRARLDTLGTGHPATGAALHTLAMVRFRSGAYQEALALEEQALAILEATMGPRHLRTSTVAGQLAALHARVGDRSRARGLAEQAHTGLVEGGALPLTLMASEVDLANLASEDGEHQAAARWATSAWTRAQGVSERLAGALDHRQRLDLRHRSMEALGVFLDLGAADARTGWEAVLAFKAAELDHQQQLEARLRALDTEQAQALVAERERLRRLVSREVLLLRPGDPEPASLRSLLSGLHQADLQAQALVPEAHSGGQVDADAVCAALQPGELLVDLVVHPRRDEEGEPIPVAAAYLVRGGRCAEVQRVELGPYHEIAAAVARHRAHQGAGELLRVEGTIDQLSERILTPLLPHLDGVRRLWVAPVASLSVVPMAALSLPSGRRLVEELEVGLLLDATGLVQPRTRRRAPERALLVGGVDFTRQVPLPSGCGVPTLEPLPGTLAEVEAVQELLGPRRAQKLTAVEATEDAVVSAAAQASVLHLATHGYSVLQGCLSESGNQELARTYVLGTNPLASSGLVLVEDGEQDGFWTGAEIMGLDLSHVELVVLSACDTALGLERMAAGSLGLRHAVAVAGVRQQLLAMWRVDDTATATLMVDFYRARRGGRTDAVTALRSAQLAALARRREAQLPEVGTWAAFSVSGR